MLCAADVRFVIQGIVATINNAETKPPIFLKYFIKIPLSVFNDKLIIAYSTSKFNVFCVFLTAENLGVFLVMVYNPVIFLSNKKQLKTYLL